MIGETLSHFRITAKLGEGGMGSVYRAEDVRLGRQVAIKVLPEAFTEDPERLARFEREAQILATLNHPHIAGIYEVGHAVPETPAEGREGGGIPNAESPALPAEASAARHFLVMELAEGETLQEILQRGAIPVERALEIGRQIANALEAAHDKGIIHRDLKPANIKVTPDGNVKVLDFGLAKAWDPAPSEVDVTHSPTLTAQMTQAGVILGTAAYMSPEQARGEMLDKRADIWAFGCVLYEMLTGRQAFSGGTVTDILASIVRETPDLTLLPDQVPRRVGRLIERCLEKEAQDRLRDIGDARIELTPRPSSPPPPAAVEQVAAPPLRFSTREVASWVLSLLLLAALGWVMFGDPEGEVTLPRGSSEVTRFRISEPGVDLHGGSFNQAHIAISPDGRHVMYTTGNGEAWQLALRSLDSLESQPIPDSRGAFDPFFSADGRSLGFFSGFGGALRTAPIKGLLPTDLAAVGQSRGGSWGDDGSIVYSPSFSSGLWRVWPATGETEEITQPDEEALEKSHRWPHVLPGSKVALCTVLTARMQSSDEAFIDAVDLSTGTRRTVIRNATYARFVAPNHLFFARGSHLLSVDFDPETLTVSGQPQVVVRDVATLPLSGAALYDVSANGTLIYISGGLLTYENRIVRYGPDLEPTVFSERTEPFQTIRLSPDERFVAAGIDSVNQAIWKLDLERDTMIRITQEWGFNDPEWRLDQQELIAISGRRGRRLVFRVAADGSGTTTRVSREDVNNGSGSLAPDGQTYVYTVFDNDGDADLWVMNVDSGETEPWLETPFREERPDISPDGRWVAYMSDESVRPEIYVQPLREAGGKIRVSTNGGVFPRWTKDGRAIVYSEFGPPPGLVRVRVLDGDEVSVGAPERLLELDSGGISGARTFDTTRDGGFVILEDQTPDRSSLPIVVVQNWTSELD